MKRVINIGESLRKYRKKSKLTKKEVAQHLGIPKQTYRLFEANERKPSSKQLKELSHLFEISTSELLGLIQTEPLDSVTIENSLANFRDMSLEEYFLKLEQAGGQGIAIPYQAFDENGHSVHFQFDSKLKGKAQIYRMLQSFVSLSEENQLEILKDIHYLKELEKLAETPSVKKLKSLRVS